MHALRRYSLLFERPGNSARYPQPICRRSPGEVGYQLWRVFSETGFQRLNCSPFYVFGRIEIRFAGTKAADVDAFGFHGLRLAIDGESERWSQLSSAFGNFHGHDVIQNGAQTIGDGRSFQSEV